LRDINVITLLNFALYYHSIAPLSAATKSLGVTVDRIMTDNGRSYRSKIFAWAFKQFGIKYLATKPYTPQTNGKAFNPPSEDGAAQPLRIIQISDTAPCHYGCTAIIGTGRMPASPNKHPSAASAGPGTTPCISTDQGSQRWLRAC
jgi:transposase InsO family protein